MVEAISVILPSSMYSSRLCCCFLLRYCISSRYSSIPLEPRNVSTSETTLLMSPVEAEVPFSLCSRMLADSAMIRATVVFPTPEGP